jgi:Zn-dependent M28 family amino/carboxypeptidase
MTSFDSRAARKAASFGALLAAFATLGAVGACRPGPTQAQGIPSPDSMALVRDLAALSADSMEGRAPGTEGGARARRYLLRALEASGVPALGASYEHPFAWDAGSGVNLIGVVRGREAPDGFIVLTAHFDHEGVRDGAIFNGADDNASGTAAALEIARRVLEHPLRHTLVVALLDAEESGLRGARAFVEQPPVPLADVRLNVNLDMVSRTAGELWAAGAHHTPALRPVLESVAADAPLTLRLGHDRPEAPEGDDWTGASDHGPFHAAGIPFVYFGVEDHPDYHRPTDDFERVDPGEYLDAVRTILAAVYALDDSLADLDRPDETR